MWEKLEPKSVNDILCVIGSVYPSYILLAVAIIIGTPVLWQRLLRRIAGVTLSCYASNGLLAMFRWRKSSAEMSRNPSRKRGRNDFVPPRESYDAE
jgi:hypothetical protein